MKNIKINVLETIQELPDEIKEQLYNKRSLCNKETPMEEFINWYKSVLVKTGEEKTLYMTENCLFLKNLERLLEGLPTGYGLLYAVHAVIVDGKIIKNRFGGYDKTNN